MWVEELFNPTFDRKYSLSDKPSGNNSWVKSRAIYNNEIIVQYFLFILL